MKYWILKSEPNKYHWEELLKDSWTYWDGVRNYAARIHLRDMSIGDQCFFYHSNIGKEIVGLAEVIKTAYQDPTTEDERWVAVDVKPIRTLSKPVTLKDMKEEPKLKNLELIRMSRLSVSPVRKNEFDQIILMSES
jgi:predicted RNA-binding protein with PUA-like domain